MKIGIAGLSHETHTFLPDKTGLEPFDRDAVRGPDIIPTLRDTNSSMGGFIQVCEPAGVELVPIVYSAGGVAGTVKDEVYEKYVGEMCAGLGAVAGELDAILLSLHGAMVCERHFRAVYEKVGEEIIIVDAPAYSPVDLSVFGHRNVPRGVYPVTVKK